MKYAWFCAVVLLVAMALNPALGQEILLDKSIKAGKLTLFQDFNDPKTYYYVPDKARLAVGEDGKPQFSFIKFVKNVAGTPGGPEAEEGEGGGIVHCLVQLGVSEDELAEAKAELRRKVPGANIAGPIIFKSGRFGIVSSFQQENGDWTTKVFGLGNAPILDGEKAAVSIRLTKLGATLLWESFKTATPDISFTFEMEMTGYRNPYDATLEADWEKIYNHRDFSAGFASSYLGFQIRDAYDELRDTGAIKLVVKGEDARMDTLVGMAYGKICEAMFDRIQGSASEQGSATSLLDKASEFLKSQREQSRSSRANLFPEQMDWVRTMIAAREDTRNGAGDEVEQRANQEQTTSQGEQTTSTSSATSSEEEEPARPPGQFRPHESRIIRGRRPVPVTADGTQGNQSAQSSRRSEPSFSLLASYTMKKVRRTGKFQMSFKKYMSDTLQLRFDENIGNLSKLMNDRRHFFEVNLDDPVFKQREISVYLDGQNASDFANYVNYVTVRLRKIHEGGAQTNDEIRIDRSNFNQNGNYFRLMYGWKDDKNRDKWMDYDYNVVWSFHGGKEVDMGWRKSNNFAITVTPPYLKRTIHLEADPNVIQQAGVRLITVKLFYKLGETEQMKQMTLNPASSQLSQTIEYIRPAEQLQYNYEITWRLKNGQTVSSGRKSSTDDFIFCDELPSQAVALVNGG
ncbi:MAG: hypothetical protein QME62_06605 [Armatimonadota bacterium]|nr:hypothetical protein [Armatimonadota bacterium]